MFTLLVLACTGGEVPDTSSPGSTGEEDSGTHRGTASLVQHGQVLCEDSTLRESEGPLVQLDHGEDWESQLTGGLTADTIFWGTGLVIEDFDADDVADGDDIARGLDELVGEFGDVN